MKKRAIVFLIGFLCYGISLEAQSLNDLLTNESAEGPVPVEALFKATRVINGHSVKQLRKGDLDLRISHRFGRVNSGAYEFFGLDQSNIHLSLEYGLLDRLMVGVGRGTFEKTTDAFARYNFTNQQTGKGAFPLTISYLSSIECIGLKWGDTERTNYFSSRLSFTQQLLVARKFSKLTVQLMPTLVHRNLVATEIDQNDLFAMGVAGRFKLANRLALNAEYYYVVRPVPQRTSEKMYNPLAIGFDIETGGHVFQIMLTNSQGMREGGFIGKTSGSWLKGDIHLGFNISRVFTLDTKKKQ
ncbi:MAG: DUF5777 family beta-barrel protein [Bacteroidales bacterium]|nr:DUF5777 family beta-barrel protein [Bacteroidales bacterium]